MPGKGRPKKKMRARYGTGSMKNPRPGYYELTISLGTDRNGKRIRKTVTGRSPEEVEEKAAALKVEFRRSLFDVKQQMPTLSEHIERWLRAKKRAVSAATHRNYSDHLRHVIERLGAKKLEEVTPDDINELHEWLEDERELSLRYIHDINATLRSCLEAAVQPRGPLNFNAAKLAESVPLGKRRVRFLTQEEVAEFLRAARGERYEHLFALMIATGLRPGEALGLPWDAIDFEAGTLRVYQSLHEEEGRLFIGPCKTEAAYRTIVLSQDAIETLRRQRAVWSALKLQAGPRWLPPVVEAGYSSDLVFTNPTGGMVQRSQVGKRDLSRIVIRVSLERIARRTGFTYHQLIGHRPSLSWRGVLKPGLEIPLPDGSTYIVQPADLMRSVNLHAFRHTFASLMIFEGVDIKTVSEVLGHESVRFTYDVYGHLLPGSTERAAKAVDEAMARLRGKKSIGG